MPFWSTVVITVGFFVGISLFFTWLTRTFFPHLLKDIPGSQVAGGLIRIVGGFYGILLGFIIIVLWQNIYKIQGNISKEASSFATIILDSAVFPATVRQQITAVVGNYVTAVRYDEWIKMGDGKSSIQATMAINNLFATIQSYQPQTTTQKFFYNDIVVKLTDGLSARRERLDSINNTLPLPISLMLFVGSILITVLNSGLGGITSKGFMLLVNASVAGLIAFSLTLIVDLNHPFIGSMQINSTPFTEGVLAQFK